MPVFLQIEVYLDNSPKMPYHIGDIKNDVIGSESKSLTAGGSYEGKNLQQYSGA